METSWYQNAFDKVADWISYLIVNVFRIVHYVTDYSAVCELNAKYSKIRAKQVDPDDPFSPYRCLSSFDRLKTTFSDDVHTVADLVDYSRREFGSRELFGTRAVLDVIEEKQENGRMFKKYILDSKYEWTTGNIVCERIELISEGLLKLGVRPKDSLIILCETRLEWLLTAMACMRISVRVVTLYATLSNDDVVHAIKETGAKYFFTSVPLLARLSAVLEDDRIEKVFYTVRLADFEQRELSSFLESRDGTKYMNLEAVEQLGSAIDVSESVKFRPNSSDVAVVMYTSGSTSLPKGVLLTHSNLLSAIGGFVERFSCRLDFVNDILISYLPLAHIYEMVVEFFAFGHGLRIGYSSPYTLTGRSTGVRLGDPGDINVLRPSLMASVPMVLDRIVSTMRTRVNKLNFFQRHMLHYLLRYKRISVELRVPTPILDKFIFSRANKLAFGGRLRAIMCGGAPLSPETQKFIQCTLCVSVFQAYALTETTAVGSIADDFDDSIGSVGHPLESVEIRLRDWEEAGYLNTDKPRARGEILIGGGPVASGYLARDDSREQIAEQANFFEINGVNYYCTGDIGEIDERGVLHIIDRKKDLVKTSRGEYVSLAKVENAALDSPLVDTCCGFMNKDGSSLILLVLPNKLALEKLVKSSEYDEISRLGDESFETQCVSEAVATSVLNELKANVFKKRLEKFEMPACVTLISDQWEPDSAFLTASFKVKRKNIFDAYRQRIEKHWKI